MKCAACHRTLVRYALTARTKEGVIGWGPTCAKGVQVTQTRAAHPRVERRKAEPAPIPVDPRQMSLALEVTA
jgi:hypothetical protein